MKVWAVFESDGYDVHQLMAVYDNKDAADLHAAAIDDASKRPDGTPGVDSGEVEEWDVLSEFDFDTIDKEKLDLEASIKERIELIRRLNP
jgi:hypothetical protein